MTIKLFLSDDAMETIEALTTVYTTHPGIEITGHATTAADTLAALEAASTNVDMISLDIQLGRDNGIELCRIIRSRFPHIYVVMCSLESDAEMRQLAADAGAHAFLSKPFGTAEVRQLVDAYREKRAAESADQPTLPAEEDSKREWVKSLLGILRKE